MGTCFTMKMGTCSTMKMGTCFTINTHIVLDPPRSHAVGAGSRELGEQIHHDRTCGRSLQLLHARACYALRSLLRTVQPVQSRPVRISTPDSLTWPCSHAPHLLTCALTYLPAHSPTYLRTHLLTCALTYYLRTHLLTCALTYLSAHSPTYLLTHLLITFLILPAYSLPYLLLSRGLALTLVVPLVHRFYKLAPQPPRSHKCYVLRPPCPPRLALLFDLHVYACTHTRMRIRRCAHIHACTCTPLLSAGRRPSIGRHAYM